MSPSPMIYVPSTPIAAAPALAPVAAPVAAVPVKAPVAVVPVKATVAAPVAAPSASPSPYTPIIFQAELVGQNKNLRTFGSAVYYEDLNISNMIDILDKNGKILGQTVVNKDGTWIAQCSSFVDYEGFLTIVAARIKQTGYIYSDPYMFYIHKSPSTSPTNPSPSPSPSPSSQSLYFTPSPSLLSSPSSFTSPSPSPSLLSSPSPSQTLSLSLLVTPTSQRNYSVVKWVGIIIGIIVIVMILIAIFKKKIKQIMKKILRMINNMN